MKPRSVTFTVASLVLLAAILFWLRTNAPSSPGSGGTTPEGRQAPFSTKPKSRPKQENPPAAGASNTVERPESREAVLTEIENASLTYDAKALPRIQPYLLDPDPEVRAAAVNGMIVLGDASAGTMLREAARRMTDPREATRLLDAADYVELPSGTPLLKKRRAEAGN